MPTLHITSYASNLCSITYLHHYMHDILTRKSTPSMHRTLHVTGVEGLRWPLLYSWWWCLGHLKGPGHFTLHEWSKTYRTVSPLHSSLAFDVQFPMSQFLCSFYSLILICLEGWKLLFDLEWPILKCLHSGKECQVAYAKTYLNKQCNGIFGCALRNITSNVSVVKYWASWSFPDENPLSRKEIISNYQWGDYCIGLWWILFDLKRNA